MANRERIRPPRRARPTGPAHAWFVGLIIVGTIVFNAALAFLNARGFPISPQMVMASEALLLLAAGFALRNSLTITHLAIIGAVLLYALTLCVIRSMASPEIGLDPKIARDLLIPVIFFLVGLTVHNIRAVDKIVAWTTLLLLVFAVFEYLFLPTYLQVFEVAKYYIARGTLEGSEHALDVSQGLMVSGHRVGDQARTLLPFLGPHRVSSLFLEPSTLGNFGALVTLWAVVRSRMEKRLYVWCALGGLALIVLSDTRLAALVAALGFIIVLLPPRITTPAMIVAPFVAALALWFLGAWTDPPRGPLRVEGLGLYERLLYSGQVLHSFNVYNLFGLSLPPRADIRLRLRLHHQQCRDRRLRCLLDSVHELAWP